MTHNKDKEFAEWLEAQPDDRVFKTQRCGCVLHAFGKEALGMKHPEPGYEYVWERQYVAEVRSASKALEDMMSRYGMINSITAAQFKALYRRYRK